MTPVAAAPVNPPHQPPRRRRIVTFLAVIGGITTAMLGLLVLIVALTCGFAGSARVPARTVLEIDFERGFVEQKPGDPLAKILGGGDSSVTDLVAALERASKDDRVVGLVGHLGAGLHRRGDHGLIAKPAPHVADPPWM